MKADNTHDLNAWIHDKVEKKAEYREDIDHIYLTLRWLNIHDDEFNFDIQDPDDIQVDEMPEMFCRAYDGTRHKVRSIVGQKVSQSEGSFEQCKLYSELNFEPKQLQKYYSIERNGRRINVHSDNMDVEEWQKKKEELKKNESALKEHIREIERVIRAKQNSATQENAG